jgi:hypothetical protein
VLIIKFPYYRTAIGGNIDPVTVEASGDTPLSALNDHELRDIADMIERERQRRMNLPFGFGPETLDFVRRNDKLGLIKHIRMTRGLGLGDSKTLVDREWATLLVKVAEVDRQ